MEPTGRFIATWKPIRARASAGVTIAAKTTPR
jgi:hypothetical protein